MPDSNIVTNFYQNYNRQLILCYGINGLLQGYYIFISLPLEYSDPDDCHNKSSQLSPGERLPVHSEHPEELDEVRYRELSDDNEKS